MSDQFGAESDDRALRRIVPIEFGVIWVRTYVVSQELDSASIPARGDLLDGQSGLTGARLLEMPVFQPQNQGKDFYVARWIVPAALVVSGSPVAPVGTYQEVRGSRRVTNRAGSNLITRIGVASNTANLPDKGDLFPGDTNELTGRRVIDSDHNETTVPGLLFSIARYMSFRGLV